MGILFLTGQPGHGKTAYGLIRAKQFKDEGREVYAHGIKDLDYDAIGFKPIEDPTKWQDLPDRSVIVIDECYSTFPNRNPGAKVPDHVEAMARHRHRGFDFILIAQQGLQVDPFLRGLFEEHFHLRQTSIFKSKTKIKKWTQYQSNVQGHCADIEDWLRPNDIFKFYTSTTFVTTKRRMPQWLKWTLIGFVALLAVVYGIKWRFEKKIDEFKAEQAPAAALHAPVTGGGTTTGAGAPQHFDTPADYVKAHTPRISTIPGSAPIFDGRAVTTDPQLYCMEAGEGVDVDGNHRDASCSCMTEQATPYKVTDAECRMVARQGAPYNPYRRPDAATRVVGAPAPASATGASMDAPASASSSTATIEAEQASGYGDIWVGNAKSAPR